MGVCFSVISLQIVIVLFSNHFITLASVKCGSWHEADDDSTYDTMATQHHGRAQLAAEEDKRAMDRHIPRFIEHYKVRSSYRPVLIGGRWCAFCREKFLA